MFLPPSALALIKEYSKPQTRPNWKKKKVFTFSLFYRDLLKKQRIPIMSNTLNKIYNGHSHYLITSTYLNNSSFLKNEDKAFELISKIFNIDTSRLQIIINRSIYKN